MSVNPAEAQLQPFFLPGSKGKIFCTCFRPLSTQTPAQGMVFFPAFAEEMNKSRRIVAEQARAFAALGYTVLLVDGFGTGDSAGDFAEADWDTWVADTDPVMQWMLEEGIERVCFWGMRLGALLALDCARHYANRLDGVLLWQPVIKGKNFLTQFLRLRLAADLVTAGEKITTRMLREQLADGSHVEVAGYELSPRLAAGIDGLDLETLLSEYTGKLLWLEVLASEERPVPAATARLVDDLQQQGRDILFHTVVCETFWSLAELVPATEMIDVGTATFRKHFQCSG